MLKSGYRRKIKKIPADTKVAECIKADAGTGASIESGNQIWQPIWADLINAAPKKKKLIRSNILKFKLFNKNKESYFSKFVKILDILKSLKVNPVNITPTKIKKSLNLLKE